MDFIGQSDAFRCCDPLQRAFHQRWHALRDAHARALAALLCGPDLLDPAYPRWQGRLAPPFALAALEAWLAGAAPALAAHVAAQAPPARLGRYAETLVGFYFAQQGQLAAQGVQVRAPDRRTLGEFDFLLKAPGGLRHIELATKFYLQAPGGAGGFTDFVGPNLADSLARKMDKIMDQQLLLGQQPAARALLGQPVLQAQALVRGWMFYRAGALPALPAGLAPGHAHGFWCPLGELDAVLGDAAHAAVMPRMQWLAPYALDGGADPDSLTAQAVRAQLAAHFARHAAPLQLALLAFEEGQWVETRRGFVVPDDWGARAALYAARTRISA